MLNRNAKKHQTSMPFQQTIQNLHPGCIVGEKFTLIEKVGQGSFGYIFKTENNETKEIVATKFERRDLRKSGSTSLLVREIKVLLELSGIEGFPQIYFYGRDDNYNYCMITYLGHNLEYLFKRCKGFSKYTCLKLTLQLLERLELLHNKQIIHRDLKPENIVIGYKDTSRIYLIDFGLSKYYRDSNGQHIPQSDKKGIVGTARYASIAAHLGHEQSRKDDLESLAYVAIYLNLGKLPWMNLQIADKHEKYATIVKMKQNIKLEDLCQNIPECYQTLLHHAKTRDFEESPNYQFLKDQFKKEIKIREQEETYQIFDWENLPEVKRKKQSQIAIPTAQQVIRSTIKRYSEMVDEKKSPSQLFIPEADHIENKSRAGVSANSVATSKLINYQVSSKNIVEVDKYRRFMQQQMPRGARQKSATVLQKQPQKFLKETSKQFEERKKTQEQVDQDFASFDDLDQLAPDTANLHFSNIQAFSFKHQN